ncbi:MAG: acetylneuraminic acid synthetase [Chlorobiaceae bacterium]|nr:acetylneuraminic acid synthetase [Chlorobiaceae bacterium]
MSAAIGKSIRLGTRLLTETSRPYIIAEIGVNHEGSLDLAKTLIELAKEGGADAAKFQSYKAETLASKNSPAYWDTSKEPTASQYQLFRKYDSFGPEEYMALAAHCRQTGIDFVSTPFDDQSIEFLDPIVPFFKIASADITNVPFLRKIASKGKPVLLSTGASTLAEIDLAIETLVSEGCQQIVLLHCILNYPTDNRNANLRMISGLARAYPSMILGYSDHTLPDGDMSALVTAHLLGAVVIEKHFSHDKTLPGNDHYHAMDLHDLRRFVSLADRIHTLLGESDFKAPIKSEAISRRNARRSIVLVRDIAAGEILMESDLTCKRPGTGIGPEHWDEVVGRTLVRDLHEDDVLHWEHLQHEGA